MKKLLPLLIVLLLLVSCNLPFSPSGAQPTSTLDANLYPSDTPQVIVVTATPPAPEPTEAPHQQIQALCLS
jgi:hypothetical protein